MEFTKRARSVAPSLTLALTAKTAELKEKGVPVITFGVGEPDFNTPQEIVNAGKTALDLGHTKYTAASGTPLLKKAICQKLLADNGLKYGEKQIVVSNGAKHSLYNCMQILVEEGDEVIIPSPYWLTYPELVRMCGGVCVYVQCLPQNGFIMNAQDLRKAITPKTKVLLLNSPNNPTGAVYSKEQLEEIVRVLKDYPDIWVVSDEIYEKLIYEGNKHYSVAQLGLYDRTIIVNGMSKAYAMTGWRIGYCACPDNKCASLMAGLQSHQTSNPNSSAQYASAAALSGKQGFIEDMRAVFDQRRLLMLEKLSSIKCIKAIHAKGAFYVMIDVSATFGKSVEGKIIDSANTFSALLLEHFYVVTIPCEDFGAPRFVRLSYATNKENITEGLDRLSKFIDKIK